MTHCNDVADRLVHPASHSVEKRWSKWDCLTSCSGVDVGIRAFHFLA